MYFARRLVAAGGAAVDGRGATRPGRASAASRTAGAGRSPAAAGAGRAALAGCSRGATGAGRAARPGRAARSAGRAAFAARSGGAAAAGRATVPDDAPPVPLTPPEPSHGRPFPCRRHCRSRRPFRTTTVRRRRPWRCSHRSLSRRPSRHRHRAPERQRTRRSKSGRFHRSLQAALPDGPRAEASIYPEHRILGMIGVFDLSGDLGAGTVATALGAPVADAGGAGGRRTASELLDRGWPAPRARRWRRPAWRSPRRACRSRPPPARPSCRARRRGRARRQGDPSGFRRRSRARRGRARSTAPRC